MTHAHQIADATSPRSREYDYERRFAEWLAAVTRNAYPNRISHDATPLLRTGFMAGIREGYEMRMAEELAELEDSEKPRRDYYGGGASYPDGRDKK